MVHDLNALDSREQNPNVDTGVVDVGSSTLSNTTDNAIVTQSTTEYKPQNSNHNDNHHQPSSQLPQQESPHHPHPPQNFRILALYKFVRVPKSKLESIREEVEQFCRSHGVTGTLLLAPEGINGTICYPHHHDEGKEDDPVQTFIQTHPYFHGPRSRVSHGPYVAFRRLKIKIKREIVTMGFVLDDGEENDQDNCTNEEMICTKENNNDVGNGNGDQNQQRDLLLSPCRMPVGRHVPPQEWNDLLLDPDVAVIDTRNEYEIDIGTFRGAINPHTTNFKEFPDWLSNFFRDTGIGDDHHHHNNYEDRPQKPTSPKAVAMFCTGGIRCEKATALALRLSSSISSSSETNQPKIPILHLEGGILAYLENVKREKSLFDGQCFVFDQRVSVGHGLEPGPHVSCHACRRPLLPPRDLERREYVPGVSCHHCIGEKKNEERFTQRERQVQIARERGQQHIYDPKALHHIGIGAAGATTENTITSIL